MTRNITMADDLEINKRKDKLESFLDAVIDPDERPYFVSDEASVYDITLEEDSEVINKINQTYNVSLGSDWLGKPLWQLLDYLHADDK